MEAKNTAVDLGDVVVVEIMKIVRGLNFPVHRKAKALVRAGKIGEMYLGILADEECIETALTVYPFSSPTEISAEARLDAEPS